MLLAASIRCLTAALWVFQSLPQSPMVLSREIPNPAAQGLTAASLFFRTSFSPRRAAEVRRDGDVIISLGGQHIRMGFIEKEKLTTIYTFKFPKESESLASTSPEAYLDLLRAKIGQFLADRPSSIGRVHIGTPGFVRDGVIVKVFNLPLTGINLASQVQSWVHAWARGAEVAVTVENDLALEARAEQKHVEGRFLFLTAGTGLNAAIVHGERIEVLEFGAWPVGSKKTLERRYQEAKEFAVPEPLVDSFIEELVQVLSVADVRTVVLAGGAPAHFAQFLPLLQGKLAARGLRDVRVLMAREDEDERGLRSPLPPMLSPETPRSARSRILIQGLHETQQLYETFYVQKHVSAKEWFTHATGTGPWIDPLAQMTVAISLLISTLSTWTAEERHAAGVFSLRLRQTLRHLEAELRRIEQGLYRVSPRTARAWRGWRAPLLNLIGMLDDVDEQLLNAAGRSPTRMAA
jgi:hypothetical protein